MSDVFISYKRENLATVSRLVEALRAEGIGVWWDQDIAPNAPWEATIERELAAARLVIVAWSPASVASENVKAEARWARTQGRLLQVFVEACEPPLFFGERQGVDLKAWTGAAGDPVFRTLLQTVRAGPTRAEAAPGQAPDSQSAPALPSKPSIAVLPFANLSGDPEQEYFADGMVEEIATAMSRCRSIFVIGASSGLAFKGKGTSPQEAARILGVRYILEGSVRKAANRVRIAVKLTDAEDGAQIWADRFEDTLDEVFALQDKVALSVAGVIEPALTEAEIRRVSHRPTQDMGGYDLALRAMAVYRTWARGDVEAALELLRRAIDLDPDNGPALAMAATCLSFQLRYGWTDDAPASLQEVRSLCQRAMKAARDDATTMATLATPFLVTGDYSQASAVAKRATDLNPGSSLAWVSSGCIHVISGQPQLGLDELKSALRLDPISAWEGEIITWTGMAHFILREFAEALPLLQQATQLRPNWALPYVVLAAAYGHSDQLAAAREAFSKARAITSASFAFLGTAWPNPTLGELVNEGLARAQIDPSGPG